MFSPEIEARFKRIEDAQVVTAELQRRFELEGKERIGRLEAIQEAMAQWLDEIHSKINVLIDAQMRSEAAGQEMKQSIAELSRTVDRFLKSRTNGGATQ